ncbi:MAG: hypothetical protein V4604_08780 [Bacteroidota bacterium]
MNKLALLISVFAVCNLFSQENKIVYKVSDHAVALKWYTPTLIIREQVKVYRSLDGGSWVNLTGTPLQFGTYKVSTGELAADTDLKQYIDLVSGSKKPEGMGLLLASLKSFKSNVYCKYLGNYYEDLTVPASGSVQYKIVKINGNTENEVAVSEVIMLGSEIQKAHIDSLKVTLKRKGVDFGWKPEPTKYFGVEVYRSLTKDSIGKRITIDPVLVSKIKDPNGVEGYPKLFFSDEKLKEKQTYYYTLVGLDFFGEYTEYTEQIAIRIKDETLPEAPVNFRKTVYGKSVQLNWSKELEDDDFAGYKVYVSKEGKAEYTLQNTTVLAFSDSAFRATVPDFGLYFFKVAATDEDGNEAFAAELIVDVVDNEPPMPPENVLVTSDTARLIISWDANKESDILGYKIYRSIENDKKNLTLLSSDILYTTAFNDSLPANALNKFSYAVLAVDTSLNESKLSVMASNAMTDALPPTEPFLKKVSQTEDKIVIEWVRNTELDLVGYDLYRQTDSDSLKVFKKINTAIIPKDIAQFFDRSLEFGKQYSYYLVAVDQRSNQSNPSNHLRVLTKAKVEKANHQVAISKLKFEKATGSVKINWKSSVQEEKVSYVVFKRTGTEEFKMISTRTETIGFRDTAAAPGQTIEYQVRMYDEKGNVTRSDVSSIVVPSKNKKAKQ